MLLTKVSLRYHRSCLALSLALLRRSRFGFGTRYLMGDSNRCTFPKPWVAIAPPHRSCLCPRLLTLCKSCFARIAPPPNCRGLLPGLTTRYSKRRQLLLSVGVGSRYRKSATGSKFARFYRRLWRP